MILTRSKWKPIEDLPKNWMTLVSTELKSLAGIWKSQAKTTHESNALNTFNQELGREWAIETGVIENIYFIDRAITQLLIDKGIETALIPFSATDKPADKIVPFLISHQEALETLFNFVEDNRELSLFFIRELHQIFTQYQETVDAVDAFGNKVEIPLLKGQWKQNSNNPTRRDGTIDEYRPPIQVQSEMEHLLNMHLEHSKQGVMALGNPTFPCISWVEWSYLTSCTNKNQCHNHY